MKKKAIEKIPFGKEKIHKLDDCFMIDGKWIDRKTNNINVRVCLREHEFANYIEGIGWNQKVINSWNSNERLEVKFNLTKKEKQTLKKFYDQRIERDYWIERDSDSQVRRLQDEINEEKSQKRYEKRQEKIKEHRKIIKPITKGVRQWAERQMLTYLFYKESTGYCGHCGQEVTLDRKKMKITHNKKGICPNCRKRAIFKAAGRQKYIEDFMKIVRFQKTEFGITAIESKITKKSFAENKEKVMITDRYVWYIEEHYELYNENSSNQEEEPYWCDSNMGIMNTGKAMIYPDNIKQVIKGTCLERSGIDIVASWKGTQEHYEEIISNYLNNPQLELIIKADMRKLTRQLWCTSTFLQKGTKLHKVLGLTKPNMRIARDNDLGREEIEVLRNDPDGKLSLDEIIALKNAGHHLKGLRRYTTITKIANYTEKGNDAGIWLDYLKMAHRLGYNMKDKAVLFPGKLKAKHDDLTTMMEIKKNNEKEKDYQRRIKELESLYHYETKKYTIIVPNSLKAIIEEGKNLHHCVGTYIDKVVQKETDILFIRKKGEEDKSYYTMEVRDMEIIQYRGAYNNQHNNPVPEDVHKFVKQFHRTILKRVRKAA